MAGVMTDDTSVRIAEPPANPGTTGALGSWPRRWPERERLLERQHDRLEALLTELLLEHAPERPNGDGAEALVIDRACRRLLWDLRLHLRLEERWLAAQGCLCAVHQAAHQDASHRALTGFMQSTGDRSARHQWLLTLQTWFLAHRQGPDAMAYARATDLSTHPS